jgi:phenylalanyl-tRNA synthetase alpha chain
MRHEREILKLIIENEIITLKEISNILKLKEDYVRGIIETLRKKNIIKLKKTMHKIIKPGERLLKIGNMPEIIIFRYLKEREKVKYKDFIHEIGISEEDVKAGLGKLIEKKIIKLDKKNDSLLINLIKTELPEEIKKTEEFLVTLLRKKEIPVEKLDSEKRIILKNLAKRPNFVIIDKKLVENIYLTSKTKEYYENLEKKLEKKPIITQLTPEILSKKLWRTAEFKQYDLNERFFKIYPGKIHPLRELIREVKEIFLSMGFEEAEGPLIELAFINFDMLFQPQDHPARDMLDTFYIKKPKYGEIIYPDEIVEKVRKTHIDGWVTGSAGWGGNWDIMEAKKLVLRTHTTAVTIRSVYEKGEKPSKIFSVGRVFRNETVDYKHFVEFHQVDGIIIDKKGNLRQLMGVIEEFYRKMGFKNVRFWPSYFPYTEPSIQPTIYVEKWGKWLELGGAGIFRPEVTIPLGVKWPVLAWGLGLERILMIRHDIDDIRIIYNNSLSWLRNTKLVY